LKSRFQNWLKNREHLETFISSAPLIPKEGNKRVAKMNGKVIFITGAKGGLGSFVTRTFLEAGATVIGVSRSIKQSDFPVANFTAMPGELTSGKAASELAASAVERFGKVDVLVHLIGGFAGGTSVVETDDATLEQMTDINLHCAFYAARAVLPHMRSAKSGRIIAIGSRTALEPAPGLGAYSASKAALVSLISTIAIENKDLGITANVILPGAMDTPANRAADPSADYSKWIQPGNVADLIRWLASDKADQVSGAVIPVYGRDV
jgi:NAD(P)-dependent dehydrogenase (short-subunit alcohol dehydrogenase family)